MMRWVSSSTVRLFVVCLGVLVGTTVSAGELRTWTDSTGRYTLRAVLVSVADGSVTLRDENGKIVKLPLGKLSRADQQYLAKRGSDNPFAPAVGGEPSPSNGSRESLDTQSKGRTRIVKAKWSACKAVKVPPNSKWNLAPPEPPAGNFRPRSVVLPENRSFFEKLHGLAVNLAARKAVVSYVWEDMSDDSVTTRVVLCDLARGSVVGSAVTKGKMLPLALHDDGQRILMRRDEFYGGTHDRLELWALQGKQVVRLLVWTPYDEKEPGMRDVRWAEFTDADTLATSNGAGDVVLWNIATVKPLCHMRLGGSVPALSPDRKWIAFCSRGKLGILDVAKRRVIAMQDAPPPLDYPVVTFSPSGRKIGCVAFDRVLVWDTASGQLERDFKVTGVNPEGILDFPDEEFVLLDNQYLIDLKHHLKLWYYYGSVGVRTVGRTTFLPTSQDGEALVAARIPHPAARSLLEKVIREPGRFAFRKGTPVKLDLQGIPAADRSHVESILTKLLGRMNCPVQETAEIVMVAKVEGPKPKVVTYFPRGGTFTVQEYIASLDLMHQGKVLWNGLWSSVPDVVSSREGESFESLLRKLAERPPYRVYENVVLPEFLQDPAQGRQSGPNGTLGSSDVNVEELLR